MMHKAFLTVGFFLLLEFSSIAQENNNNYYPVQTKIDNGTAIMFPTGLQ